MRVSKQKKKSIKSNVIKIKTLRPKSKPKRKLTTGTKKKKISSRLSEDLNTIPINQRSKKYFFKRYKFKEQGERHPKLITATFEENGAKKHEFMGFTESEKNGHKKNIELEFNPKSGDKRPAYLRKEHKTDKSSNFTKLKNYYLHKNDEVKVDEYLNKKRNGKRRKSLTPARANISPPISH